MPGQFFLASAAFIDNNGKILILKRSPKHDYDAEQWETVSGRLEQNIEGVKSELLREIHEELGESFTCEVIAPFGTYHFYRGENQTQEHVGINYLCKYLGGEIMLSKEHTEYKWIDPHEFDKYPSSESLKKAVQLYDEVRDWYLNNNEIFKNEI